MASVSSNYVNIYLWNAAKGSSLGHIALETITPTATNYVSFWPPDACLQDSHQRTSHFHDASQDRLTFQKSATIYMLTDLDVDKINTAINWEKFKRLHWKIFGSLDFFRQSHEYNCAGLVLHLLEKGGIRQLVPSKHSSDYSRIIYSGLISAGLLTGACLYSYLRFHELDHSLKNHLNFFRRYQVAYLDNHSAISWTGFILNRAQSIFSRDYRQTPAKLIEELSIKILNILKPISESNEVTFFIYGDVTRRLEQQVATARINLAIPILFSIALIHLNQSVFSKTVTPAGIEKLVLKAIKKKTSL